MRIYCPFKPKKPYRKVIEELSKRAEVEIIFARKIDREKIKEKIALLDPGGEEITQQTIEKIVKEGASFVVGGPDGIDMEADYRLSLGKYILNHQITLIVLLDLLFRAKNRNHPYCRH